MCVCLWNKTENRMGEKTESESMESYLVWHEVYGYESCCPWPHPLICRATVNSIAYGCFNMSHLFRSTHRSTHKHTHTKTHAKRHHQTSCLTFLLNLSDSLSFSWKCATDAYVHKQTVSLSCCSSSSLSSIHTHTHTHTHTQKHTYTSKVNSSCHGQGEQ